MKPPSLRNEIFPLRIDRSKHLLKRLRFTIGGDACSPRTWPSHRLLQTRSGPDPLGLFFQKKLKSFGKVLDVFRHRNRLQLLKQLRQQLLVVFTIRFFVGCLRHDPVLALLSRKRRRQEDFYQIRIDPVTGSKSRFAEARTIPTGSRQLAQNRTPPGQHSLPGMPSARNDCGLFRNRYGPGALVFLSPSASKTLHQNTLLDHFRANRLRPAGVEKFESS